MFQRDHDNNITTPMRCGGYDYATGVDDAYVDLAYEAVVAIARAAHDVVEGGASECVCERARERSERQKICCTAKGTPTLSPSFALR